MEKAINIFICWVMIVVTIIMFVLLARVFTADAAFPRFSTIHDGVKYTCDQPRWLASGIYCSTYINGKLTSLGLSVLIDELGITANDRTYTGIIDANGDKIYNGDQVTQYSNFPVEEGTDFPHGIVSFQNNWFVSGWQVQYGDYAYYPLALPQDQTVSQWKIIK